MPSSCGSFEDCNCRGSVFGGRAIEAPKRQLFGQNLSVDRVVVDDENTRTHDVDGQRLWRQPRRGHDERQVHGKDRAFPG